MASSTHNKNTVWYKEHYDKIAVVAVLIALLVSALFLLLQIGQAQRDLASARWDAIDVDHATYQETDLEQFETYRERLESPVQIGPYTNALMVSELRVVSVNPDVPTPIPYDAETCPWTGYEQPTRATRDTTGDGIPDEWLTGYGLDPFDPAVAEQDSDGDGFTVREEFEAETSPVDPQDHPSHAHKLRLRRVATRPFGLRFQGIQEVAEGDIRFHLNVRGRDRSYFPKLGETIEGYTLVDFEERSREGVHGRLIDASVLTLERPDGREVDLTVNVDYRVDERIAELIFLTDQSIHRVHNGDTLELMGQTYNVIDIQRDTVLIRDEHRQKTIEVGRETPADRRAETDGEADGPSDFEALMEEFGQ